MPGSSDVGLDWRSHRLVGVPQACNWTGSTCSSPRKTCWAVPLRYDGTGADREINPGKVFDLQVPLTDVAEGYRAMDERRVIKTLLRV